MRRQTNWGLCMVWVKMKYIILICYNCIHATFKALNMFLVSYKL